MICFHQCNVDCLIAKEAVVGKALYRPDQAYGYELVIQGFVVLAPESINCGERNVPSIRKEGESKLCHAELGRLFSPFPYKDIYDGMRAVDLLQSLDFVDENRIGVIGHSMGVWSSVSTMAYDQRVKAGIISCEIGPANLLPLISPRLLVSMFGELDKGISPQQRQRIKDAFDNARRFYEDDGVPDNLILRFHNCAHYFSEEFKLEAYEKLKTCFGKRVQQECVPLGPILKQARQNVPWAFEVDGVQAPEEQIPDLINVMANEKELIDVFVFVFNELNVKRPANSPLRMEVHQLQNEIDIVCAFSCSRPEAHFQAKGGYSSWLTEQAIYEHSACLKRETTADEVRYIVTLQKANPS